MVRILTCVLLLLSSVSVSWTLGTRYDDYKLLSLIPNNVYQLREIKNLEQDASLPLDFWSPPHRTDIPVDVMIPPHAYSKFIDILKDLKVEFELKSNNVQSLIDKHSPEIRPQSRDATIFNWKKYNTYEEINDWLLEITRKYRKYAALFTIGQSYEGRIINGVKVSFGPGKKAVFIEGGIHAREWITPATVTYILNEILTSENREIREIAEMYDWYFVPTINPDGYVYTFTTDRLWRRTRSKGVICDGADANRNWDFHWNETGTGGECTDFYPGKHVFSEPEIQSLSKYLENLSKNKEIVIYLAIHSPFQQLLLPYTFGERPENFEVMLEIGKKAVKSLTKRHGTEFDVGNWAEEMYPSSGVSIDWVTGVLQVPFAYSYELRDRKHLFFLPPKYIIPVGEETMDSIVTLVQEVNARGF